MLHPSSPPPPSDTPTRPRQVPSMQVKPALQSGWTLHSAAHSLAPLAASTQSKPGAQSSVNMQASPCWPPATPGKGAGSTSLPSSGSAMGSPPGRTGGRGASVEPVSTQDAGGYAPASAAKSAVSRIQSDQALTAL